MLSKVMHRLNCAGPTESLNPPPPRAPSPNPSGNSSFSSYFPLTFFGITQVTLFGVDIDIFRNPTT